MEFVENPEEAELFLMGAAINQGSENEGCADAPLEVRKQLDNLFFSENATTIKIQDKGDVTEKETFEQSVDAVFRKAVEILKADKPIITIGGNHSVSMPLISAFTRFYNKIGVIHFDAHPDCQIDYMPYGDVMGAVSRLPEVKKIVMIGLRNWSKMEYEYLKSQNIQYATPNDILKNGIDSIVSSIQKQMADCDCVYLSVDIDAIDPAFAPGTGWTEPGGLSSREVIYAVQKIAKFPKIMGMDLVEINPKKDINEMTAILGAKLIFEFANSMVVK